MTSRPSNDHGYELSQLKDDDIFTLLLGPGELDRSSRTINKKAPLLKLYEEGLSSAKVQLQCKSQSFHKVVMEAVRLCAQGWPTTTREAVMAALVVNERAFPANSSDSQKRVSISEMAIDFGLRMWLMLDCCDLDTPGRFWEWPPKMPISDFVKASVDGDFSAGVSYQDDMIKKLPRKFTAQHLESIAGIEVQWTDFLSEHLIFNEAKGTNGTLILFGHKGWLMRMLELPMLEDRDQEQQNQRNQQKQRDQQEQQSEEEQQATTITLPACGLPRQLIEETFYSLKLLCPDTNSRDSEWLEKKGMYFPTERTASRKHPSHIPHLREFTYLRERLLDLIEEYQAPPRHWKNVFTDRRNPTTFWTFWIGAVIGALTLIFGVFAIVLAFLTLGRTN